MRRWPELLIAVIVIVFGANLWLGYGLYQQWSAEQARIDERLRREVTPVSDWFEVRRIAVPDYKVGTDPQVLYDRLVKLEFTGDWFVKIYDAEQPSIVACSGEGSFRYKPKITLPKKQMALSVFIGKQCNLKPGCYTGEYRNEVRPDDYPMKPVEKDINRFCVIE